jgi:peptide/nickel transport system permease protein
MVRIPVTLKLSLGALVIVVFFGLSIGIISAVKQYSFIDTISLLFTMIATAMPAFWLGLLLMLFFALQLGWLPATGVGSFSNYIMPWITIAFGYMAMLVRMTRSSMLEVIRQDYTRTARAKGAKEKTVILKHALRNALLPIITVIGLNLGQMVGGSLVTETVFALPGVGTLLLSAIRQQDIPIVMATIIFVAIAIGIINLIVDILYAFVDPRLRTQFIKER